MTFIDQTYLPLKVFNVGSGGKRTFDPDGKRRLIAACRQPGVSISYMALQAGINANQLRKWVDKSARSSDSAFVPVTPIDNSVYSAPMAAASAYPEMSNPSRRTVSPTHLTAQLSNGVTIRLECGGHDAGLVMAMIQALGAI